MDRCFPLRELDALEPCGTGPGVNASLAKAQKWCNFGRKKHERF